VVGSVGVIWAGGGCEMVAGMIDEDGEGPVGWTEMASVLAIGGVFVKSKDVEALRAWYREMLGLEIQEWGGAQLWSSGDRTYGVWSAFRAETKYFEPSEREFMVNLRVDDLDGLLARLRERGAQVLDRRDESPDGKFGYVVDPDGPLLELWEAAPG
jgi:predicted enzyme related to lactoylglutathione lyase